MPKENVWIEIDSQHHGTKSGHRVFGALYLITIDYDSDRTRFRIDLASGAFRDCTEQSVGFEIYKYSRTTGGYIYTIIRREGVIIVLEPADPLPGQ